MKNVSLVLCMLILGSIAASAQMVKGGSYVGFRVGLGARNSSFAFSADYDYLWKKEREFGPGSVALGASIDASFPSESLTGNVAGQAIGYSTKTTFIPISVHTSYHFGPMMDDKRIDPYFLVGLAYRYISVSNSWPDAYSALNLSQNYSDVVLVGCLGCRYFFSPAWSAHARLGFGMTFISAGLTYALPQ